MKEKRDKTIKFGGEIIVGIESEEEFLTYLEGALRLVKERVLKEYRELREETIE